MDLLDKNLIQYKVIQVLQHTDLLDINPKAIKIPVFNNCSDRLSNVVSSILQQSDTIPFDTQISDIAVQGDTATAYGIALAAFHRGVSVIHIEAGMRTYRAFPYPEEVYRRAISLMSFYHFCPTEAEKQNLQTEQVEGSIYVVGNTALDNLVDITPTYHNTQEILCTIHRRENWDNAWHRAIERLAKAYPEFRFTVVRHPNRQLNETEYPNLHFIDPLPHRQMAERIAASRLVITDSGGIQEEASFFKKWTLVCRDRTERECLSGIVAGIPDILDQRFNELIRKHPKAPYDCPFGDGTASKKIYGILEDDCIFI